MPDLSNVFTLETLIGGAAILVAIVIHEICHGLAALKLGDDTAKEDGRLTFNPIKHIDPVGAILLLVVNFGWAKPVMVDMRRFENPKRDMAIVAVAGPASNFALAAVGAMLLRLTLELSPGIWRYIAVVFLFFLITRSVALGIFNLFPIPPLDGSKILAAFLPDRLYVPYMRLERYGMIAVFALVFLGVISVPLLWMLHTSLDFLFYSVGLSWDAVSTAMSK
ncbi:MAG: site-2 protease family protein [Oscillospiraceae bacterium]|nr:site-2 protease family protein [Oscillospiraceae bacterium]